MNFNFYCYARAFKRFLYLTHTLENRTFSLFNFEKKNLDTTNFLGQDEPLMESQQLASIFTKSTCVCFTQYLCNDLVIYTRLETVFQSDARGKELPQPGKARNFVFALRLSDPEKTPNTIRPRPACYKTRTISPPRIHERV